MTTLTISNDDSGAVTMSVGVGLVTESMLIVFLDTDMNGQVDRTIAIACAAPGVVMPLAFSLDGSGNATPIAVPSLRASATTTTLAISFAKTDLAVNAGFAFYVYTYTPDGNRADRVPDMTGMAYLYLLTTAPAPAPTPKTPATPIVVVKPVIGAPVTTPAYPQAGKRFTVVFPVTRSDNGPPLTTGTMICDPSMGGKVITHSESFKGGSARLSFLVPKTAKGRTLQVKVKIAAGDQSALKIASFKVR